MANSDSFEVTVRGSGGHAASPHLCHDPIPVAAQIVTALQDIVARHFPAKESAVLSITPIPQRHRLQYHTGCCGNQGERTDLLCGKPGTGQKMIERLRKICGSL